MSTVKMENEILRNALLGAWRLEKYTRHALDGSIQYPFGVDPDGMILYTEDGHMSASLMWKGRKPLNVPASVMQNAIRRIYLPHNFFLLLRYAMTALRFFGYSGTFRVAGDQVFTPSSSVHCRNG